MFLGHIAVAFAGKRAAPSVSLATWIAAAQFVDLVWPFFLLAGLEHVRIAPGITRFTPLDFTEYPITHSLLGTVGWAAVFAGLWLAFRRKRSIALLLGGAVVSHWVLDVVSHRPDVPLLPGGPYLGLGLWHSVAATLAFELTLFGIAILLYIRGGFPGRRRASFWALIAVLVAAYFGAAFGPPPPDTVTLATSALALWVLLPLAWFADRPHVNSQFPNSNSQS